MADIPEPLAHGPQRGHCKNTRHNSESRHNGRSRASNVAIKFLGASEQLARRQSNSIGESHYRRPLSLYIESQAGSVCWAMIRSAASIGFVLVSFRSSGRLVEQALW